MALEGVQNNVSVKLGISWVCAVCYR